MLGLGLRFRVYLSRLVPFYQAYCTVVVRYCYVTSGASISFQISRSTGVSVATALNNIDEKLHVTDKNCVLRKLHPLLVCYF